MKEKKAVSKIVLISLILLFFCLLCLIIFMQKIIRAEEKNQNSNNIVIQTTIPQTVADVIKKHNSEFLKQDGTKIYAKLDKDLYDENGKSNKKFLYALIEDLTSFFENLSFYVIDEEKNIEIHAVYNQEAKEHEIVINNIKNFYDETDGKSYITVEKSEIVQPSGLHVSNGYLERLVSNQMFISSIKEYLDEGKELDNGYTSYYDGIIRIKLAPNKSVMNIIFSEDYEYDILTDVNMDTSLSKIYELHNDNTFGSLNDKYLGYRSNDLYYFFYNDEVSVYGYSYRKNTKFENLLDKYLKDKDLDSFITELSKQMLSYDLESFEYDADIKKAHIVFPTRGIEIDILDNNPNGITLYNNYYFTDKTKEFVKNGLINFESDKDLIEKYEIERREAR